MFPQAVGRTLVYMRLPPGTGDNSELNIYAQCLSLSKGTTRLFRDQIFVRTNPNDNPLNNGDFSDDARFTDQQDEIIGLNNDDSLNDQANAVAAQETVDRYVELFLKEVTEERSTHDEAVTHALLREIITFVRDNPYVDLTEAQVEQISTQLAWHLSYGSPLEITDNGLYGTKPGESVTITNQLSIVVFRALVETVDGLIGMTNDATVKSELVKSLLYGAERALK